MRLLAISCWSLFISHLSLAQTKTNQPVTRILFLLDGSNSMLEAYGADSKMAAAQRILSELVDSLRQNPNVEIALRVYGHQTSLTLNDCNDTKLEVPFGAANIPYIKQVLDNIRPKGVTPIAASLEKSAKDFPPDPDARNIIVLITDGVESCGGDPCAISLALQREHVFLKPFIIGLDIDPSMDANMECIGSYYNALSPIALKEVLNEVVQRILSVAYVKINLLDIKGKPLETDVDMSFSDSFSGISKYNFYHTLNYRGESDTLNIDPICDYDVVIHTNPPIRKEHIQLEEQKTNVFNIPAAQGFLEIELLGTTINKNLNSKIKCLIRQAGTYETISVQDLNSTNKYLAGRYDIQVLTLPRMEIKNVEVTQSSTTTIQIQAPGVMNLLKSASGYGAIFSYDENQLVKIYQLNENLTTELVGLQPGNYVLIFRPKFSKKSADTIEKKFTIITGQTISIKL